MDGMVPLFALAAMRNAFFESTFCEGLRAAADLRPRFVGRFRTDFRPVLNDRFDRPLFRLALLLFDARRADFARLEVRAMAHSPVTCFAFASSASVRFDNATARGVVPSTG